METDSDDYEIGYGKPPKHTQFKKGQSGNPLGRPKKKRAVPDLIEKVLSEEVMVSGKKRSKRELFVIALVNDAIKGNATARRLLLSYLGEEEILEEFSPELDDQIALLKFNNKIENQLKKEKK